MNNVIIYLLGFPGTGKYTIAKEICAQADNFKLVDNHLINNPVFSLIHKDGVSPLPDRVWKNAAMVRDAVMDTMVHISPPDYSFVLTNALFESDPVDHGLFGDIFAMAQARGARFVPVRLLCSVEEMERRIVRQDRVDRFKESDPTAPRRYVETEEILKVDHPNVLDLDVSEISPAESVAAILSHARSV